MVEKYGVGTRHITNEGCWVGIVEKLEGRKRKVKFENGCEVVTHTGIIIQGKIKNPYHPSVLGVGCFGVGDYRTKINGRQTQEYGAWTNMLQRCYDNKYQEKFPTYKNVTICEEWLNFQNFARWHEENHPKMDSVQFHIDKDLLQENVENKVYSPNTCVFIPQSVNAFLANKHSNNTSGYTGVSWFKRCKKWETRIKLFGEEKKKHLGYFTTYEQASEAYEQARTIESEKVKSYLRSLNYLSEEVIQLVK